MKTRSDNLLPIVFINSHPVQYFAPLYQYMNKRGLPTSCWYCSDENVKGHLDRQFGVNVAWDIPVLEGYAFRFFKNYSWKGSIYNGFFGLINLGMFRALLKEPKSVIIIHGWAYLTHVLILIFARLAGHIVCLRGETPLNQEVLKSKKLQRIKKLLLGGFLFRFVHKFLYIGTQNKAFYCQFGIKECRLVFLPYAVDNKRLQLAAKRLLPNKSSLRKSLGIPVQAKVILFTAKYISKKRPLDLLMAFQSLRLDNKCLVMVGDGELRLQMTDFIKKNHLKNVHLTGFVNQTEIEKYYVIADVFVMCSHAGETWGLSVNEAMNFNLPVVVSQISGCCADLVKDGINGFTFKEGHVDELEVKIKDALCLDGSKGKKIINKYSFDTIVQSVRELQRELKHVE